ncbi:MAG: alcohol dehydrogenase catalytic domain-containing protein, partial [Chloroflexi bacterium]|nr:alcohol dehydrogenase catalytic domain-containing protein [Chloroflexota bacterium]
MKALVKEKPGPGLSLLEIAVPHIEHHDDVQFRVAYCAICVGEMKIYDWSPWAANDPTLRLPTVLGHEVSGVVTQVGADVTRFQPGDRVVVDPLIHCGHCYMCRKGHTNMCLSREIYGKRRGAFAEYAVLPERALAKMPEGLSLEAGALLENLGIAVHAVEIETHDPGDVAVVVGCGPIGIMAGQALEAYGCTVVMTDLAKPRLEKARELISGKVIDVSEENPVDVVREMTSGRGADFVLEAAATQSAFDQALALVRSCGTVVTIGTFNEPITFNPF